MSYMKSVLSSIEYRVNHANTLNKVFNYLCDAEKIAYDAEMVSLGNMIDTNIDAVRHDILEDINTLRTLIELCGGYDSYQFMWNNKIYAFIHVDKHELDSLINEYGIELKVENNVITLW